MNGVQQAAPRAITDHRASRVLEIAWDDGHVARLPHARLRAACRCAACVQQGRTRAASGVPTPDVDPAVALATIAPVGDRGLNLVFSDGHGRGLYPWAYLRELG